MPDPTAPVPEGNNPLMGGTAPTTTAPSAGASAEQRIAAALRTIDSYLNRTPGFYPPDPNTPGDRGAPATAKDAEEARAILKQLSPTGKPLTKVTADGANVISFDPNSGELTVTPTGTGVPRQTSDQQALTQAQTAEVNARVTQLNNAAKTPVVNTTARQIPDPNNPGQLMANPNFVDSEAAATGRTAMSEAGATQRTAMTNQAAMDRIWAESSARSNEARDKIKADLEAGIILPKQAELQLTNMYETEKARVQQEITQENARYQSQLNQGDKAYDYQLNGPRQDLQAKTSAAEAAAKPGFDTATSIMGMLQKAAAAGVPWDQAFTQAYTETYNNAAGTYNQTFAKGLQPVTPPTPAAVPPPPSLGAAPAPATAATGTTSAPAPVATATAPADAAPVPMTPDQPPKPEDEEDQ